jgi:hypothetical protein
VAAVTITRVGTNQKYADGWEQAFSKKRSSKPAAKKASPKKPAKKAKR